MQRQIHRKTERWEDKQMERWADELTDRGNTDGKRLRESDTDGKTGGCKDIHVERQVD